MSALTCLFASYSDRGKHFVELVSALLLMAICVIVIWLSSTT